MIALITGETPVPQITPSAALLGYNRIMADPLEYPRLRPVELAASRGGVAKLMDRSGIAQGSLSVSHATLAILSLMDGRHRRSDIQADFMRRSGRMLFSDELDGLIDQLDQAHFLEGPIFEARWQELSREYAAAPLRRLRDVEALGAPASKLGAHLDKILSAYPTDGDKDDTSTTAGLVAPHLDYDRGAPCYAAAYGDLVRRTDAVRFVILGTNHFGRSRGVVGTRLDFATPWGSAACDAAFMRGLDQVCGVDLCEFQFDHAREHSIELQVVLLKHLLRDREFCIAPYLCSDPCGPTGTKPSDGRGVDLHTFATALGRLIASDDTPTCVIAGADLSHVGRFFNDDRDLDESTLASVESSDRTALGRLTACEPEAFRTCVASTSNATNFCSVGCLYALATVMQGRAAPRLLHYHQAVVKQLQNCVTCAAMSYTTR